MTSRQDFSHILPIVCCSCARANICTSVRQLGNGTEHCQQCAVRRGHVPVPGECKWLVGISQNIVRFRGPIFMATCLRPPFQLQISSSSLGEMAAQTCTSANKYATLFMPRSQPMITFVAQRFVSFQFVYSCRMVAIWASIFVFDIEDMLQLKFWKTKAPKYVM